MIVTLQDFIQIMRVNVFLAHIIVKLAHKKVALLVLVIREKLVKDVNARKVIIMLRCLNVNNVI